MEPEEKTKKFLWRWIMPRPGKALILRLGLVILVSLLVFRFLLLPEFLHGASMLPTYPERGLIFCWTPPVWFGKIPPRGSVVMLSYAGHDILLLKRIIAFPGETVEFRQGKCYVNGEALEEPYVKLPCNWNMDPVTVKPGKLYVIGDNRSTPIRTHVHGQIDSARLKGVPLW